MKFSELGIIQPILRSIEDKKFEEPSEIQEKTIPLVISGKDIIAESATGSGKTLAFAAGVIQRSEKGKGIQALIMTPTRELAHQIAKDITDFSRYKPLSVCAVYGGVSITPQMHALKTADIVIGTPGRILDHLQRRTIKLGKVSTLVLDEADRMLDMGFIDDVKRIIGFCPENRQTLLFSATLPSEIRELADEYMKNPVRISAEAYVDENLLEQYYYDVPDNRKFSLLVHLLKKEDAPSVMVFCNTQKTTDLVAKFLKMNGINALAIHGGLSQAKRSHTLSQFHSQRTNVLVCTDVAARGLDIKDVTHVYNYDLPKDSKSYVHRIGRTARAGKQGKAINILASRDHDSFSEILRNEALVIKNLPLPEMENISIRWEKPQQGRGFRRGNQRRRY